MSDAGPRAARPRIPPPLTGDRPLTPPLILTRGTLVALNFYKAKAARVGTGDMRQINLMFRARVADDA